MPIAPILALLGAFQVALSQSSPPQQNVSGELATAHATSQVYAEEFQQSIDTDEN